MLLRFQSSNGDVIDHALHFLNVVLESIEFLPQIVVLEIQETEPSTEFHEEEGDGERTLVVALGYTVNSQSRLEWRKILKHLKLQGSFVTN